MMKPPNHSNIIEVLGRNHLIAQLIEDGVHAAIPLWDHGVDLVAYHTDKARPLQLKVSAADRWGVYKKYEDVVGLLMVHIWNVKSSSDVEIYAMSYRDAVEILNTTSTYATSGTWTKELGHYDISPVPKKLRDKLKKFRMGSGYMDWQERLKRN